jgi:hypothetical protein
LVFIICTKHGLNFSCYKPSSFAVNVTVKKEHKPSGSGSGVVIQLNLAGLIVFSLALIAAAALVAYGLAANRLRSGERAALAARDVIETNSEFDVAELKDTPAWGQFVTRDLDLEQPDEYVAYETSTNKIETWTFAGMSPDEVRALMQSCGLAAGDIDRVLQPAAMLYDNSNTVVTPDEQLVFSMPPQTRANLYGALSHYGANELMQFPFCFPSDSFETNLDRSRISPETYDLVKKMLYPRGTAQCFSDLKMLLQHTADEGERLQLVKALSHQSALLVGIHVWPDTDIDKLIGYWAWPSGVRLINVRPLLESLKRRPNGGSASILYFLPPFARERLYTYPLPAQLGDPAIDCHWSTMNFFNETPDNRFSDPSFTVAYIKTNLYQIAKPTAYGDRVFLLDKNGNAVHSAVYLADDIVFTKNGNNFAQPWMLMRLKDLLAEYTADEPPGVAVYRDKNW